MASDTHVNAYVQEVTDAHTKVIQAFGAYENAKAALEAHPDFAKGMVVEAPFPWDVKPAAKPVDGKAATKAESPA